MRAASKMFSEADRERVRQAVVDAETRTSAEIVPVVASSSGRYDRGEDICGLWLGLLAMLAVWALLPRGVGDSGAWGPAPWTEAGSLAAAVVVGFLAGAVLATRIGALKRLFTSRGEMREEVDSRARSVFFDSRVHHTEGSSGLLVYVSLLERMAAVIADQAVLDAVGQESLDELCRELTGKLATGGLVDALCATITSAGDKLAPVLPRAEGDVNELADALVTLD